jgi:ABC-type branched-subunit amino acid transport system substrate-binding protein
MLRKVSGIAAVLAVIATIATTGVQATASAASKKPITIGVIAGTTGAYGTTGQAVVNGSKMAVAKINASGGVLGRKLKLVYGNDAASSTTSALLFKKFVGEGAVAMFGSPDTATVTVSLADKDGIPDLGAIDDGGAAIYPTGPTKTPHPWAWSTSLNTFAWGQIVGDYANSSCPTGLAMVHDPTFYGLGGLAGVKETYKKTLKVDDAISEDWSSGSTQSLVAEITKIVKSGADCVDVWLTPQDDATFVKEVHSLGDHLTVLGNDETCATTVFSSLAGTTGTGMLCAELTSSYAPNAKVKAFYKAYKKEFNVTATAFAMVQYDAINMFAKALTAAKSTSPKAIQKAMNKVKNFPGLSGSLTYTAHKHVTITAAQLTLVKYAASSKAWVPAKK